jgi:transcriptional regulator with XRE-family HTH domain
VLKSELDEGLARYEIGPKLRALRLKKKMGLVQVGKATGLSSAMLSKIERGRLFPTLPTLFRIASVFSVGLDHFFTGMPTRPGVSVIRRQDRTRQPSRTDGRPPSYFFEPLDFAIRDPRVKAYYAEFERLSPVDIERHTHPGIEIVFVITGMLAILLPEGEQLLHSGDAIAFEAERPHGYTRRGELGCAALVVLSE